MYLKHFFDQKLMKKKYFFVDNIKKK